jgi:hypothetical protein
MMNSFKQKWIWRMERLMNQIMKYVEDMARKMSLLKLNKFFRANLVLK